MVNFHSEGEAEKDIPRICSFINADEGTVKKLYEHLDDTEELREIIKSNAKEDFVRGIMNFTGPSPYSSDRYVEAIALNIIDKSGMRDELMSKKLGIGSGKSKKKSSPGPVIKPWKKGHDSKTKSGKSYKKGYKAWSSGEQLFVKSRKNKKPKQIQKEFELHYGYSRSVSSITTQKSRTKK